MQRPSGGRRIQRPFWNLTIPGWKDLRIVEFHIRPAYLNVLEGSIEGINSAIVRSVPQLAGTLFGGVGGGARIPVYLSPLPKTAMEEPLPPYLCMALATADPVKSDTCDEFTLYSRLVCCWFAGAGDLTIGQLLAEGIRPFPWDEHAQNWGV